MWLDAIGHKKLPSHSLAITRDTYTVIETERRVLGQTHPSVLYLNKRSLGHNLSSIPGQAELIAQYFSKTIYGPLERRANNRSHPNCSNF
jgi:hypothetical protein